MAPIFRRGKGKGISPAKDRPLSLAEFRLWFLGFRAAREEEAADFDLTSLDEIVAQLDESGRGFQIWYAGFRAGLEEDMVGYESLETIGEALEQFSEILEEEDDLAQRPTSPPHLTLIPRPDEG